MKKVILAFCGIILSSLLFTNCNNSDTNLKKGGIPSVTKADDVFDTYPDLKKTQIDYPIKLKDGTSTSIKIGTNTLKKFYNELEKASSTGKFDRFDTIFSNIENSTVYKTIKAYTGGNQRLKNLKEAYEIFFGDLKKSVSEAKASYNKSKIHKIGRWWKWNDMFKIDYSSNWVNYSDPLKLNLSGNFYEMPLKVKSSVSATFFERSRDSIPANGVFMVSNIKMMGESETNFAIETYSKNNSLFKGYI